MDNVKIQNSLYTPQYESDSCGVGMIADLNGHPSRYIIDAALTMLENMKHRGATGYESNTGDGAGMLIQIPHEFFKNILDAEHKNLPAKGKYGVGMCFFPNDEYKFSICLDVIKEQCEAHDFEILFHREVPTNNSMLGKTASETEPRIVQLIFKSKAFNYKDIENRFYFFRNNILKILYSDYPEIFKAFYFASLSSKTIVYKGLLSAIQLRKYYVDFNANDFQSALAIIHSRFSTNTLPEWKLAQPFRSIAHNGEINTIQGNLNSWKVRENYLSKIKKDRPDLIKIFPVCDPSISDSGNFDNVVDFLQRASRSIPHAMMMMIPESWQNDDEMPDYKKAFYQYHDAIMEPWDGPASICFTDGNILGATLDRNGLRPSRYLLTNKNILILASEAGCIPVPENEIIFKSRLEPGKILVADLEEHRIISDEEVKSTICKRKPYLEWLNKHARSFKSLPEVTSKLPKSKINLTTRQIAFGFNTEAKELIVAAMASNSKEPVGSMGADIPLPVLSRFAQHPANYFKQQFAQVTNPPIDSIREAFYMSLKTSFGAGSHIIGIGEEQAKVIEFESPVLTEEDLEKIIFSKDQHLDCHSISITYRSTLNLKQAIDKVCKEVLFKVEKGVKYIRLTDRYIDKYHVNIPSLLITGAVHHQLINLGLRKEVALIIDAGDIWETHHIACLLSYGADLICPYIALEACYELAENAAKKYITALNKGLLKIMSKLGISTLNAYKGAQTFEALGIHESVIEQCFKNTTSRISGLNFEDLQRENKIKHQAAFNKEVNQLPDLGNYRWRKNGEEHLFNPQTIHLLKYSTQKNDYKIYKKFSKRINELEYNKGSLRSFLKIKKSSKPIPLEKVESVESILKRFATGAMSFGSISYEAHTTLARAMNAIGGKSNSGEGGEDDRRYDQTNGQHEISAIKQIASGRFGVTSNYLTNAKELQIKMAQGAKPGEGGQLPGHKVNEWIAKVRHSTPGVGLISPPPHHDIYSIEDLAQLIYDLKNANQEARISVKLVSKAGVGVIASGVAKAHAEHILISGADGGTGASPLSSIRHAGLPWELGLAETHQTLMKNGLRDRVVLQADGQIRTGRDLAIATMLGAEEWGIATAALVVEGCILMRKCHLNTCPVGIATQDPELRKKFEGKSEHIINYFYFLAKELRAIMSETGMRTVNELVGRTDLLEIHNLDRHWKTKNLKLNSILFQEPNYFGINAFQTKAQNHNLDEVIDQKIIQKSTLAIHHKKELELSFKIKNTDRAVGAMLSNCITKRYGAEGLSKNILKVKFKGSGGQSFGSFLTKGVHFKLEGESNDYLGKGLSGGMISVKLPKKSLLKSNENIIIGNVALYGATGGKVFINGKAGDRFAVRNSGAIAVVEGIGHNGCEYMTGGTVVILGETGKNFGAGMSGGIVFMYRKEWEKINQEHLLAESPDVEHLLQLNTLIDQHAKNTSSNIAINLLFNWEKEKSNFVRVIPKEYKAALELRNAELKSKIA